MLVGLMLTFISSLYAVSTYCAGFDNAEWQKNYSSEFINYPVNDAWLGSTFSIVEYREHIKPIIQDDYNKEIQAWFLGLYKKGDIIQSFSNPVEMWESLQGVRGYVLTRKGKQVATFITDTSNIEQFLLVN